MSTHLRADAAAMIGRPLIERLDYLDRDKWVGYPKANETLAKMERLLTMPSRARMPNLAILGAPGAGKTHILQRFVRKHPGSERPDSDHSSAPIVIVNAPYTADSKALLSRLLKALSVPHRETQSAEALSGLLLDELIRVRTRLLIIDEFHDVLTGSTMKQRQMLACIKDLSNSSRVAMVIAGLPSVGTALAIDNQLRDRFDSFSLPPWQIKTEGFGMLLASFEATLPLPCPSNLSNDAKSATIYHFAGGMIGRIAKLIYRAAEAAMKADEEFISIDRLNKAGQRCLEEGWK